MERPVRDFWAVGPTATAVVLRARGFSPRQAEQLVRLKLRYARGEYHELTPAQRRLAHLLFLRWASQRGWFDDGEPARFIGNERRAV
jgi:hypothetical protein